MYNCQKEFATLLKATIEYLQQDMPAAQREAKPLKPTQKAQPKQESKPIVEPKKEHKPPTNWSLTPMSVPEAHPPSFTAHFKTLPLDIPIYLLITDESQSFFLENVARALTRTVAPAALFSGKLDLLLTRQSVRLVLAPLSFLKKRFPQVELHQFLKLGDHTLLPLADNYDVDLKRDLWNKLKNFPNTPLSS